MPRYVRNSAILAKIETTYGTDPTPTGAANAVLVSNLTVNPLNANNVPRNLIRPYFGGSEHLIGSRSVECSFDVEFQSSGSMTTPTVPAWDALLQACGYQAGSGTAGSRVEYALATDYAAFKSLTIYYHDDGVLHKLLGARGNVSLALGIGERPVYRFRFVGLDGGVTAVSNPTPTLTAFKTPLVMTDANTGAVTLGCTYAIGALSSGTEYITNGLEIDLGNDVNYIDLLGTAAASGQTVEITNRDATGKIAFDLTAANEVTFMASVLAATTQSLGLVHGTTAGYKMLVYAPAVQMINPRKEDQNGRRIIGFDLRFLPSSGNDELKLVAL
ncbi:MAG: hypothetical protein HYY97_15835 [Rhodocyclales bacterium]|nr:hypothetical protein [Rhodocyclales bacterium]